jgi:hypothetical protein
LEKYAFFKLKPAGSPSSESNRPGFIKNIYLPSAVTKGMMAMVRALLIATVSSR